MRICNVCLSHDAALGGLHRAVEDFARALGGSIISFDDARSSRSASAAVVPVTRIACGTGPLTRDCHRLSGTAVRHADAAADAAELLVVHSLYRGHVAWASRRHARRGTRCWAVPHGCLDPRTVGRRGLVKRAWLRWYGRGFLDAVERVVFSSRRSLENARPWVTASRAVSVPWPVDLPPDDGRDAARAAFRSRHAVPEDDRVLLCLGRLHSVKRPIALLDAFCAAATDRCHLVVAGMDGDLTRADLEARVPVARRRHVHFTGPLDSAAVAEAYLASDGFVSLSGQENFGYAAAEAVAYALPVILSPGHDLAHEMPKNRGQLACGWLLADDSPPAAVAAIEAFAAASIPTLRAAGCAGRSWAGDVLARDRFVERLRGLAGG